MNTVFIPYPVFLAVLSLIVVIIYMALKEFKK